jgi:hypothetical protein
MHWRYAEQLSPFPRRAGDVVLADHQQTVPDEHCDDRVGRVKTIALGAICAPFKDFPENSCDLRIHLLCRPLELQRWAGHLLGLARMERRDRCQNCDHGTGGDASDGSHTGTTTGSPSVAPGSPDAPPVVRSPSSIARPAIEPRSPHVVGQQADGLRRALSLRVTIPLRGSGRTKGYGLLLRAKGASESVQFCQATDGPPEGS